MVGSSALLRRRRRTRILRISANFRYFYKRGLVNRPATTGEVNSPLLLLPPQAVDGSGDILYRFHCLATNKEFSRRNKIGGGDIDITKDVVFVGSSHGWVALHNRRNSDLLLSNPFTDRHIKLPPLFDSAGTADRVILSSSIGDEDKEDGALAFMSFGHRRSLAFCSPLRSKEWTLFGGGKADRAYENLVYSSKHNRLFCFNEDSCNEAYESKDPSVESWDFDREPPTLDRVIRNKDEFDFYHYRFYWPKRDEVKKECFQMKYLISHDDDDSDHLFLVVRHVSLRAGPFGSMENKVTLSKYRGCHYIRTPYKTIDFDVYKIDLEGGGVMHMKDSLEGLSMFVGTSHPFAIPAAEVPGVKPDSVYFTDDNRVFEPRRLERTNYGGHDNGIFDYRNKVISACCDFYPIEFEKIRQILPLPLWFRY